MPKPLEPLCTQKWTNAQRSTDPGPPLTCQSLPSRKCKTQQICSAALTRGRTQSSPHMPKPPKPPAKGPPPGAKGASCPGIQKPCTVVHPAPVPCLSRSQLISACEKHHVSRLNCASPATLHAADRARRWEPNATFGPGTHNKQGAAQHSKVANKTTPAVVDVPHPPARVRSRLDIVAWTLQGGWGRAGHSTGPSRHQKHHRQNRAAAARLQASSKRVAAK
eukprot:scaffold103699_cov19-Tisochrysis_lutea.AAC.1